MEAFERIYRQHVDAVFRYALRCCGNRELAEDLVSEAFLALHARLNKIDTTQLPSWLFTVVRNKAVDYWRKQSLERRAMENATEGISMPIESLEAWLEEEKSLKPVHRACLILRYVHGLERIEIAERLGLNENQVKSSLQYALTLLRKTWNSARGSAGVP